MSIVPLWLSLFPKFGHLRVAEAADQMVVDHPHRLHVGVDDCAADELKAALFEVLAQRVGLGELGGTCF